MSRRIIYDTLENYDIDEVQHIEETVHGSGGVYIIITVTNKYVLKMNQRADFAFIQNDIYNLLSDSNIEVNQVVKTKKGALLTESKCVLYTYVEGYTLSEYSMLSVKDFIKYLVRLHKVLEGYSIDNIVIETINSWDYAKSLEYVLDFVSQTIDVQDNSYYRLQKITQFIQDYLLSLQSEKQLIHADLGIDNFLLHENQLVGILDFTPSIDSVHASLGHFMYWNILWKNKDFSYNDIEEVFHLYNKVTQNTISHKVLLLHLIKVAIYRFSAPMIDMCIQKNYRFQHIKKRVEIAEKLIDMFYDNQFDVDKEEV